MRRGPQPGIKSFTDSVTTLETSWGEDAADWMRWLAEECNAASQAAVAKRIGYSGAYISNLLNNKFRGDLSAFEQAIRGALRSETVSCPGIGQEIAGNACLGWQKKARKMRSTNPLRVKMYRACRGNCPHSRLKGFGQ